MTDTNAYAQESQYCMTAKIYDHDMIQVNIALYAISIISLTV